MSMSFDEELESLEEALSIFVNYQDKSFSIEKICELLGSDELDKDDLIEKISKTFGVHSDISCIQIEAYIRERIDFISGLKKIVSDHP